MTGRSSRFVCLGISWLTAVSLLALAAGVALAATTRYVATAAHGGNNKWWRQHLQQPRGPLPDGPRLFRRPWKLILLVPWWPVSLIVPSVLVFVLWPCFFGFVAGEGFVHGLDHKLKPSTYTLTITATNTTGKSKTRAITFTIKG